ncbi:hypothetical protein [Rhizobium sp. AG855]|uniref:hypothetical protein n=1 Tax=Rhizobium sp. AG855 TaxID=2183898 RepID=UPI000E72C8AC|nr:hypothetical protein [Rhizobium sp. AG855]RKE85120.1 hypothetical protein DFO46_1910 [Rhizobium sp. AG855]
MVFGLTPFTLFHVVLSLVGIVAGFVALRGWLESSLRPAWTAVFLVTTIATTLTGFLFPFAGFTPAIGVGLISAILLALAVFALYRRHLLARWRPIFIVTAIAALYLNSFVLIAQAFLKVPTLHALAPTGTEPAFAVAQGLLLLAFLALGYRATTRFRSLDA